MPKLNQSGVFWLWLGMTIFLLDQLTKSLAQYYLSEYTAYAVMPGFNFILSFNTGAAFSFLDSAAGWQGWFFGTIAVITSVILLIWLRRLSRREYLLCIALNFIIGGALGNLYDRIKYGYVIDFIQWYAGDFYWPVFNIADSAICVGAALLVFSTFKKQDIRHSS